MITLRYMEREQYDPVNDRDMVQMMAVSNKGTWYARTEFVPGQSLRVKRQAFMDYVNQAAQQGYAPCEVTL